MKKRENQPEKPFGKKNPRPAFGDADAPRAPRPHRKGDAAPERDPRGERPFRPRNGPVPEFPTNRRPNFPPPFAGPGKGPRRPDRAPVPGGAKPARVFKAPWENDAPTPPPAAPVDASPSAGTEEPKLTKTEERKRKKAARAAAALSPDLQDLVTPAPTTVDAEAAPAVAQPVAEAAEPVAVAEAPVVEEPVAELVEPTVAVEPVAEAEAPVVEEPVAETLVAVAETPVAEAPVVEIAVTPPAPKKAKRPKAVPAPDPAPVSAPAEEPVAAPVESPFAELGLPEALVAAVKAAGFESPTPIQARAIPPLLAGRDLVGQAQTGTGKTAAFALPLLASLDPDAPGIQALVVVPTRELAIQAAEQIHRFGPGVRVVPVYGGQPIDRQFRSLLKPPAVVVGTPGRLLDHLRRASVDLGSVRFCALDEADEMLSFGFIEDIETILAELPQTRQTALFSATMPPRIAALAEKFLVDPVTVSIETRRRTVDTVRQAVYEVAPGRKREALARILDMEVPGPTIVFCRTRAETQELADALRLRGYDAEPLHGDMAQAERDRIMKKFRDEQTDLLVATDVAARGLDIEGVTHVVNFDLPWDVEQYIHRIGRTGRAGREGDAITLIEPAERRNLRRFEYLLGLRLDPRRLPSVADIAARRREVFTARLEERLERGGFDEHLDAVGDLAGRYDLADVAAAALQLLWEASGAGRSQAGADELSAEGDRPEAGMARLFVSLGRVDRLRPTDLIGLLRAELNLPPKAIGTIDILDRCAFVEVPKEHAEDAIRVLGETPFRGRRPKAGYATARTEPE